MMGVAGDIGKSVGLGNGYGVGEGEEGGSLDVEALRFDGKNCRLSVVMHINRL